ncbi:hypothetical protein [Ktedonobacter racemifer]|uniref:Uncharacterized protein n=1 Tax=Ktedonobacter racemifer DSM 44963 TaxID=485913 RepID=D6TXK9_KTERA|nr:hypothetical protein [Ktedonobacter racemifer]EFH84942.1 hypothetical protein Krac_6068 [Ktedonobacter racemifer DSM 44963]
MAALIDYPQRYFELWNYTPTFNQLLFLANPSMSPSSGDTCPLPRIDVLFWSVAYLQLPADFMGLTMDLALPEQVDSVCQLLGGSLPSRYHVYRLRGKEYEGYVVAGGYAVDESARPFDEPSKWDLPKGPGFPFVKEELSAFLKEGLIPLDLPASYWTKLGQRYGTWIRNISLYAEHPDEALKNFLEGVKDGYTHEAPSSDSHP